jgi:hypothetical protein
MWRMGHRGVKCTLWTTVTVTSVVLATTYLKCYIALLKAITHLSLGQNLVKPVLDSKGPFEMSKEKTANDLASKNSILPSTVHL